MNQRPRSLPDLSTDRDDRALPPWPEVSPTANAQLGLMVQNRLRGTHGEEPPLGRLEGLAMQLARIQHPSGHGLEELRFESPQLVVFASDHGIADEGVSKSPQDLTRIRIPVLVANGENDIMVPTPNSHDLARRIPGAELVIYPDASHGGIFQYHDAFLMEARAFLAT